MKSPVISIIVPTYNTEKYVEACIRSLINQTLVNIEIIIVDDGSTDNSGKICDRLAENDNRIKVIHQTNRGLGLSRNSGIDVANGQYIGFVDADDIVAPTMYEILYRNAKTEQADISYCRFRKFTSESQINNYDAGSDGIKLFSGKEEIHQYLLDRIGNKPENPNDNYYGASVCCGIFSSHIFERGLRFVSERILISEDIIFDIDAIPMCNSIVHTEQNLYYYRINLHSLTTVYKVDRFDKNVELFHEMYRRLLTWYTEEECFFSMSRYLITFARIAIMQEARFYKKNGRKYAINAVKRICNSSELVDVLQKYPYWKLPMKYAIVCFMEKHQASKMLLFIMKMKK